MKKLSSRNLLVPIAYCQPKNGEPLAICAERVDRRRCNLEATEYIINVFMKTTVQEDTPGTILSIEGIGKHVIKIETLLVPIDFSAASMQMLDYAVALARRFHAKVDLVHVYPPDEAALVPGAGNLMRQTADELFSDRLLPMHREQLSSFRPQKLSCA